MAGTVTSGAQGASSRETETEERETETEEKDVDKSCVRKHLMPVIEAMIIESGCNVTRSSLYDCPTDWTIDVFPKVKTTLLQDTTKPNWTDFFDPFKPP